MNGLREREKKVAKKHTPKFVNFFFWMMEKNIFFHFQDKQREDNDNNKKKLLTSTQLNLAWMKFQR